MRNLSVLKEDGRAGRLLLSLKPRKSMSKTYPFKSSFLDTFGAMQSYKLLFLLSIFFYTLDRNPLSRQG